MNQKKRERSYSLYEIVLTRRAAKLLEEIPNPYQKAIQDKINTLKHDSELLDIIPLEGFKGLYRFSAGDYRIVFKRQQLEKVIAIIVIAHRKEAYNLLKNLTGL